MTEVPNIEDFAVLEIYGENGSINAQSVMICAQAVIPRLDSTLEMRSRELRHSRASPKVSFVPGFPSNSSTSSIVLPFRMLPRTRSQFMWERISVPFVFFPDFGIEREVVSPSSIIRPAHEEQW